MPDPRISRVIDQNIDPAQSTDCLVNYVLDIVGVRNVCLGCQRGDAMLS